MLLRRVIEHVKAQNWTAVVLDLVIVVVGVFIGIQVANWNETRGERLAEAEYLAALEHDARFSIARIESVMAAMEQAQEARKTLYEFAIEADMELSSPADAQLLQGAMFNIQRLNVRQVAFDALTNSGQLAIIADPELVAELQALDTLIEAARRREQELVDFTYSYVDRYLITSADTENVVIGGLVGGSGRVAWIRGNDAPSLSPEQLRSNQFKNLVLYLAEMTRGRMAATEACRRQYQAVLDLILARQLELAA